ncbi:MAG TPA: PfkB family carbohydrate kinase [Mycobacteriales bacterium]|nr:PfkB family carbohydrate kinase [Mycobacteriales bacterium]
MTGPVLVFAPRPMLAVTVEERGGAPDVHLHADGQGVWHAHMLTSLDVPVRLCACFGGETGLVLRYLTEAEGVTVRAAAGTSRNGGYVHDCRDGERRVVAETAGDQLSRHELDELYEIALSEGLATGLCLLSGSADSSLLPAEVYGRLATDLSRNGCRVAADLSGEQLSAALVGGVYLLKVSHQELLDDGRADGEEVPDLVAAARRLHEAGAQVVLVSRERRPALLSTGTEVCEVLMPQLEPADPREAGDSMVAGVVAGLARGVELGDAVRLGAAAGALNVAHRGLGAGGRRAVAELAGQVRLHPVSGPPETAIRHGRATPTDLARWTTP